MKIQESLVWDKHSGELIGFVDLVGINVYFATLKNTQTFATYVLVFLVKSVVNLCHMVLLHLPLMALQRIK